MKYNLYSSLPSSSSNSNKMVETQLSFSPAENDHRTNKTKRRKSPQHHEYLCWHHIPLLVISAAAALTSTPATGSSVIVSAFTTVNTQLFVVPRRNPLHHNLRPSSSSSSLITCALKDNLQQECKKILSYPVPMTSSISFASGAIVSSCIATNLYPSPSSSVLTKNKMEIKSFLSSSSRNDISSINGGHTYRYGGRASSIVDNYIYGRSENFKEGLGVLGFDLKMAPSPSSPLGDNYSRDEVATGIKSSSSASSSISSSTTTATVTDAPRAYSKFGNDITKKKNAVSPIKKQVIKNILRKNTADKSIFKMNISSIADQSSSRRTDLVENKKLAQPEFMTSTISSGNVSTVPMWFPYIPTRQQIESLKIVELRDACNERGLIKSGNKNDLQRRLLDWTQSQHKRRVLERNALRTSSAQPLHDAIDRELLSNDSYDSFLSSSFDDYSLAAAVTAAAASSSKLNYNEAKKQSMSSQSVGEVDVDDTIEPLINRRKALLRSKQFSFSKSKKGVLGFDINPENTSSDDDDEDYDDYEYDDVHNVLTTPASEDYLNGLTKTFHASKSVQEPDLSALDVDVMNNYQLKELYLKAKYADQNGDFKLSKALLHKLQQVTPRDTRVIRRLARLEIQENNYHKGREILQSGLRILPNDANLLHGLGQLERSCGNLNKAREYFKEAIQVCPTIPNPYHALGTLEHSQGNIRAATTVLRMGLKLCPSNHRLHHALGDLYREAKMLDMAEKAYQRGLKCLDVESASSGKPLDWSRSFFYTAMSYLYYDRNDKEASRRWLKKGINLVHNKMHSQGWLGLAQLEESEGNIDVARKIYHDGLTIYEKYRGIKKLKASSRSMLGSSRTTNNLKPPKLGDKWLDVYESYIRLEEKHGTYNSANNVFSQAAIAFPNDWKILVSWSRFQIRHANYDRARTLFELACKRAGNSDSEPYRIYAEFEMSLSNYSRARSILFLGAQSASESSNGSLHDEKLAHLYHTWAICEWHIGNLDRAEVLFDHSLRVTDAGTKGSETRFLILSSIARFLFHARQDYMLAQHCVCLSLTENTRFKANWILWSKIAKVMGNEKLSIALNEEALKLPEQTKGQDETIVSVNNQKLNQMLRRAPWHHKIIDVFDQKLWYEAFDYPDDNDDGDNLLPAPQHFVELVTTT